MWIGFSDGQHLILWGCSDKNPRVDPCGNMGPRERWASQDLERFHLDFALQDHWLWHWHSSPSIAQMAWWAQCHSAKKQRERKGTGVRASKYTSVWFHGAILHNMHTDIFMPSQSALVPSGNGDGCSELKVTSRIKDNISPSPVVIASVLSSHLESERSTAASWVSS